MRSVAVLFLVFICLTAAMAKAPDPGPGELRALPDQAQVRVLGRVTWIDSKGQSVRLEANGLAFSAERVGAVRLPRLRPGDRILITGELQPGGSILLDSIQKVPPLLETRALVGTLLSVDHRRRRLVLRSETGKRLPISYQPDTTFVRLGRRSRSQELRFGDRLWVDQVSEGRGIGSATRVEVVHAREGRFSAEGQIIAVDSARQQLRVRFGAGARTVLAAEAAIAKDSRSVSFRSFKVGQQVRVIGDERRGVIVASRIQLLH